MFDKELTLEVLKSELNQYNKSGQESAGLRFGQYIMVKYGRSVVNSKIFYTKNSSDAYDQIAEIISQ